jgi:AcrR family transcriptional regulator
MKHTSKDLRVRRTLRSIRQAFYTLIMEKSFSEISITELTELAEVNRKTFYLHYTSLDDLIQEIEDEVVEEIMALIDEDDENLNVRGCISKFYHYMEDGDEIRRKIMIDPEYRSFYEDITNKVLSTEAFQHFYAITEYPYVVRAFCVSITSIYRSWINNGREIDLDTLIEYAGSLLLNGYNSVKKNV